MAQRDGQVLLQTWVPTEVAEAFKAQARVSDGGASQALRRMVIEATGEPGEGPRGVGRGRQIGVRFRNDERAALAQVATERGMTPSAWLRSLALVHLGRRPQWPAGELEALRGLFREVRRIGVNINQLAQRANEGAHIGRYSIAATVHANEATKRIAEELRKLGRLVAADEGYWDSRRSCSQRPDGA